MDKVKVYLAVLKKYHFWVLIPLMIMAAVVVRRQAGTAISAMTDAQTSKVKSAFSNMQSVASNPEPPSPEFVGALPKEFDKLKNEGTKVWDAFYAPQGKVDLFRWPDRFASIADLPTAKDPISEKLREQYAKYMKDELPKLYRIANVVHEERDESNDPNAEPTYTTVGAVEWSSNDRTEFERYFKFETTPSSELVRLAQENYWFYESLMRVVAAANSEAKGTHDLPITKILALDIAQRALERQYAMPGVTAPSGKELVGAQKPSINVPAPDGAIADLEKNRYCDEAGAPLANRAASKNPEFTFVPVYLEVVIDQRKIPKLIAECLSAPLQIRIKNVAISQSVDEKSSAAPSGGGGSSRGGSSIALNFGTGGGATRPTPTASRSSESKSNLRPDDVGLKIGGVMFIVNPPPKPAAGLPTPAPGAPPPTAAVGAPAGPGA